MFVKTLRDNLSTRIDLRKGGLHDAAHCRTLLSAARHSRASAVATLLLLLLGQGGGNSVVAAAMRAAMNTQRVQLWLSRDGARCGSEPR